MRRRPTIAVIYLVLMTAAWALVIGIFQTVVAIRLRKEIEGEWVLVLSSVASVILGVLMLISPGADALAML